MQNHANAARLATRGSRPVRTRWAPARLLCVAPPMVAPAAATREDALNPRGRRRGRPGRGFTTKYLLRDAQAAPSTRNGLRRLMRACARVGLTTRREGRAKRLRRGCA